MPIDELDELLNAYDAGYDAAADNEAAYRRLKRNKNHTAAEAEWLKKYQKFRQKDTRSAAMDFAENMVGYAKGRTVN